MVPVKRRTKKHCKGRRDADLWKEGKKSLESKEVERKQFVRGYNERDRLEQMGGGVIHERDEEESDTVRGEK